MNSQSVRSPIKTNADYLHHVIQAKLNPSSESALYIAAADASKTGFILNAADDSFTTNPAFNPTQFMPNVVQVNIGERPVIDACGGTRAIPASGMTISIPKITTNGTVATTAEGAAPSETGITSAYVSGTVVKLAGLQRWSVELQDRSDPSFAAILMDNMTRSYRKATEQATIAAIVAGGTQAATTAATAAGITSFISTESAAAYLATGETVAAYTAGVGQWSLLQSSLDTTGRPIFSAGQPMNSGGSALATTLFGNVQGIPLSVSANMVSTVVDESAFLIVPSAIELFESSQLMLSVNIPASGEIEAMIYGYFCPIVTLAGGLRRFNLT
jgi:HK97 family phage major capsid protein